MVRIIVIATALVLVTTVVSNAAYRKDRQTAFEIQQWSFAKEKFVRSKPHVNVAKEGLWVRDALDNFPAQDTRPIFGQ